MAHNIKSEQLGMPISTATYRLYKLLLFDLATRLGEAVCFRCGTQIESAGELSVDHIRDWLYVSPDLFWDIKNIRFSHLLCNTHNSRSNGSEKLKKIGPNGTVWCSTCKAFLPKSEFHANKNRWSGVGFVCKSCRRIEGLARRKRKVVIKEPKRCQDCFTTENLVYGRKLCRRCYNLRQQRIMKLRRLDAEL